MLPFVYAGLHNARSQLRHAVEATQDAMTKALHAAKHDAIVRGVPPMLVAELTLDPKDEKGDSSTLITTNVHADRYARLRTV